MKWWLCAYYVVLLTVRFLVARLYKRTILRNEGNDISVFILTVITDILLYILIRHTPTLTDKKNLFYHVLLLHSTSFVSLAALFRPLPHAWITLLLATIKIFSLYRMDFCMMIFTAIGLLVPMHNQTLLFIIMCWPLHIQRWTSSVNNDKHEKRTKKLIYCCLLVTLSIYAYVNSKPMIIGAWLRPPWMLYYDLYFILFESSMRIRPKGDDYQQTRNPSIRVRLEDLINNINRFHFSSCTQLIVVSIYDLFIHSIPFIIAFKLYHNQQQVNQLCPSLSLGLVMILIIGRQLACNADKLCAKSEKIRLYSIWLLVNISVLVFYYYIYLPSLNFLVFWKFKPPFFAAMIDCIWPFWLLLVEHDTRPNSSIKISNLRNDFSKVTLELTDNVNNYND